MRSYRPGRRAVVEATTDAGPLFLKVVRPGSCSRAWSSGTRCSTARCPSPPLLATTDDGVLVLPGLPGTPMRALLAGDGHGLPDAAELDRVLESLPEAAAGVATVGRRMTGDALARVADHAAVLGMVAEDLRPRLEALTAVLAAADPGEHPAVPVHGDFYESQLLVDDGRVVGLLDVDTAGRGHRIDDWANLLGAPRPARADPARARDGRPLPARAGGAPAAPVAGRAAAAARGRGAGRAGDRAVPGAADAVAGGHRGPAGARRGVGGARCRGVGQVSSGPFAGVVQW